MYELYYNQRIKTYPNGTKIITTFNKTVFNPLHNKRDIFYDDDREVPDLLPFTDYEPDTDNFYNLRLDNLKRCREKIFDIAYMNEFDYFITLTFDDNIVNAYDENEIHRVMRNWFNNMQKRYNMKYLAVPEYHKSGRIHWHMLASGDLKYTDSNTVLIPQRDKPVRLSTAKKICKDETLYRTVYNFDNWNNGHSTLIKFQKCDDRADGTTAIAKYLTKYITKDLTKVLKHYYYAGGHIVRDVPTEYKVVPFESVYVPEIDVKGTDLKVKYQTIGV